MGQVFADIKLINACRADVEPLVVRALADTGALMLCIPRPIAAQLRLERVDTRPARLADGTLAEVDYVGPIEVWFDSRSCFVGALVTGDEVLLGAVPMEDMDLVIDPRLGRVKGRHPEGPRHRV